jgi:hypothetical protein
LRGQTAAEEAQKANYQTNFANQRLSNLGSIGANYFNQASGIDQAGTYGRMNLEGQRLGYVNEIKQSQLENRQNLYRAPGKFFTTMSGVTYNPNTGTTNQPANNNMKSYGLQNKYNSGFSFNNTFLPDPSQTTFQPSFGAFNPNVTGSLTSQLPSRYFWEPSYKINIPQRPNYSNISLLDGYNNLWPR